MVTESPPDSGTRGRILPDDESNRRLVSQVLPPLGNLANARAHYDLVVIGAGTAGLVGAMIGAMVGAKVALLERNLLGGDCLNSGCVPSKGLIRAARANFDRRSHLQGSTVTDQTLAISFADAMARMRALRAQIATHDSVERLTNAGIDVFGGNGKFLSPDSIDVSGQRLQFRRALIATGGRPATPSIPGLDPVPYLTNETLFELTDLPEHLLVLGGGPIGCEMAQAFRRFGAQVTLVTRGSRLLPRDDPQASQILEQQLCSEGIVVLKRTEVSEVKGSPNSVRLLLNSSTEQVTTKPDALEGSHLLVAVGRTPGVEWLGLDEAGVAYDDQGVRVNDSLRTNNPRIYAAGDICATAQFTHLADFQARVAIQNAFNPLPLFRASASRLVVPWTTYTDPEIAHVGMTSEQAERAGSDRVLSLTQPFEDVDRAILDGETEGFARIHVAQRSGRILGATMVARHAGEMIGEMAVAITNKLTIEQVGKSIHPYPTQAESWRLLGDQFTQRRFTPLVKNLVGNLLKLL